MQKMQEMGWDGGTKRWDEEGMGHAWARTALAWWNKDDIPSCAGLNSTFVSAWKASCKSLIIDYSSMGCVKVT